MRILMCRPNYFGIEYEINPWMNVERKVDRNTAQEQWESLYNIILKCGADVSLVAPAPGFPDMIFTANAGLYYKNKMILAHFKYKERQGEEAYFKDWFKKIGFEIPNENPGTQDALFFEGAGDALLAGDTLFAGYGFRSDQQFYEKTPYFDHEKLVYCELVNPYYYHLDTCFCPLNDRLAIWYPPAFSKDSQERMTREIECLAVSEDEAKRFACNAIVLGNHVILPTGCPNITALLEERGFVVHASNMDQFLKAGGACKCLTLRID